MSEEQLQREVRILNKLLYGAERLDNLVQAHEILDLNRYKTVTKPNEIKAMIRKNRLSKPFVFFSNKN